MEKKLLFMKKYFVLLFICLSVSYTYGWGPTGHRATGWIAAQHLNKKAKKALEKILNGHSIAMVSTWMDEIRSDTTYNYTADWHWVTIQDGQTYEQSEKNPNGDIIQTLERLIRELKSGKLDSRTESEYVKMLIHLVGDIHQPLHVGGGNDRGGNDVKVMWFRVDSNLHRVWDSDMIDDSKLSYTELAQSLAKPSAEQLRTWQQSSVRDWATESVALRKEVYDYDRNRLGYEYTYKKFHIVRTRLLQAGVRLAQVLNDIYG
jgi:hypothetical protein